MGLGCDATPLGQFFLGYSEDMPSELLPFARHFFPIVRKSVKQNLPEHHLQLVAS
jgi:hypothetical protein